MPSGHQLYREETTTHVFPREYCEISIKTYFEDHLRTPASAFTLPAI